MTIFPTHFSPHFRSGRKYLYSIFTALLLLLGQSLLNAQSEITPEVRNLLEKLAPYYSSGYDRLTPQLKEIGYKPREETKTLPVLRQLNEVYQTAVDKDKCLALLFQTLAQQYDPVKEEAAAKPYLAMPKVLPGEVKWNDSRPMLPAAKLPLEIKNCLTVVGEYLEGGALGGTTGILKNIFGLSDEMNYELQVKSSSQIEAISRGLQHVSTNEATMRAFVGDIALQLYNNYESARGTTEIKEALQWRNNRTEEVTNWESVPINPQKADMGGFKIDTLASRIYQGDTKLNIEIVPDINFSSVKIIISPAFYWKVTTPDFYQNYIIKLVHISGDNTFSQVYEIEKDMRRVLNSAPTQVKRSPKNTFGH